LPPTIALATTSVKGGYSAFVERRDGSAFDLKRVDRGGQRPSAANVGPQAA
jgi:hypothetical protein